MPILNFIGFSCYRCGHKWVPNQLIPAETKDYSPPKVCPKCKTAWWNVPREKDIIDVINSGMFQSYRSLVPLILFVQTHIAKGDDPAKIMNCILALPLQHPANPKLWLEEKWVNG